MLDKRTEPYCNYCIQESRIESMDEKIDGISKHFQVDGIVGQMSGEVGRIATLIENGNSKKSEGPIPTKIVWWVILGLVAIIAVLLGVEVPFG